MQPNYSGTFNTAKTCTKFSQNICSVELSKLCTLNFKWLVSQCEILFEGSVESEKYILGQKQKNKRKKESIIFI